METSKRQFQFADSCCYRMWQDFISAELIGPPCRASTRKNQLTGTGCYTWSDGSSYEGGVVCGLRNGYGKFKSADGKLVRTQLHACESVMPSGIINNIFFSGTFLLQRHGNNGDRVGAVRVMQRPNRISTPVIGSAPNCGNTPNMSYCTVTDEGTAEC